MHLFCTISLDYSVKFCFSWMTKLKIIQREIGKGVKGTHFKLQNKWVTGMKCTVWGI